VQLSPQLLLFALFATTSVLAALGVVLLRDPVKGAMSLIGCFFSLACLFILQGAELIGILEVLVYAGAIMVLFVFVIMLVENRDEAIVSPLFGQRLAVPVKLGLAAVIAWGMLSIISRQPLVGGEPLPAGFGSVASVGRAFFARFLFHFEFTSILLLVGIVGAVMVSRRGRL
jgi:NADH-quinone oxidoreductase subunit J